MKFKSQRFEYILFLLPIVLAIVCLIFTTRNNYQATLALPMPQEFMGEYSYDGENWQQLTEEADISAFKGDLHLRGNFLMEMQEGWQLNYYRNHIGVLIKQNGQLVYQDDILYFPDLSTEMFASMCGRE